jgi:hypothetical protein
VFPVRYGLDLYILFRTNSVFKGLKTRQSTDHKINFSFQLTFVLSVWYHLWTTAAITGCHGALTPEDRRGNKGEGTRFNKSERLLDTEETERINDAERNR